MAGHPRIGLHVVLTVWLGLNSSVPTLSASGPSVRFEDITASSGMNVRHHIRSYPGKNGSVLRMFTSGGAAVAVGDYDNDGYEDLFITDSETGKPNHLFHNNGDLTFSDVALEAGVAGGNEPSAIVSDAIFFDYDNDGLRDLLVARFGTPILYHNEGHGKFRDVTASSGLNKFANTIAVIALDYDNDGNLDLVFGNYFRPVNLLNLKDPRVLPNNLDNATNGGGVTVYHNTGHGTFEDVTEKAGLAKVTGWTLDVGHGDFNNDGLQDIYVACDFGTDHVFLNNGDGTFREVTDKATGWDTKKGMNVDVADFNNDGWLDIYVTNIYDDYMKECAMLWQNMGDGTFTDVSAETGTCDTGWGWGAKFLDYDNDGWLDLYVMNGWVSAGPESYVPDIFAMVMQPNVDLTDARSWPPIGNKSLSGYEKKRLFHNLGGEFKEEASRHGLDSIKDGRGIAVADFDNDGRLDLFVTNADDEPNLYRNVLPTGAHWVTFILLGTRSNHFAIGAQVRLTAGGQTHLGYVNCGNGFAAQSTMRVHFGLGSLAKIDSVEVRWPSGLRQKFPGPDVDHFYAIVEGQSTSSLTPWRPKI